MTSSKYIQLSDKVLMEYEYFNSAESTSAERKEFQIPISGNVYTNEEENVKYLVNDILTSNRTTNKIKSSNFTVDNSFYCLAKASSYNSKQYVSKNDGDKDGYISAEDYIIDAINSGTGEYSYNPISSIKIACDKIKIYFTSSYTKEVDGTFAISISSYCENGSKFILGNYILNKFELVPTPFLIGERLYTKVIEFYVPSIHENGLRLFEDNIATPSKIDISFSKIFKEAESSFNNKLSKVQFLTEVASTSISIVDQYATVFANIEEVDDYFKLEGSTKNTWKTFSDFIADLPGTVDDYILMHDITVNELVTNTANDEPDWQITTHNIITQTDNFDEPTLFRPVIKNSNCIACVLDYTLRIYCNSNNTQIIKRSTYQNFNFTKYGKKMIKVNLGIVPPQLNVYNKLDNNKVSDLTLVNNNVGINISQEKIFKTSYVTSFRDRLNIRASISPVKIDNITE